MTTMEVNTAVADSAALASTGVLDTQHNGDADSWHVRARCRDVPDPDIFFGTGKSIDDAKQLCALCEVTEQCLAEGAAIDDRHSVRAGLTGHEREVHRIKPTAAHRPRPPRSLREPTENERNVARLTRAGHSAPDIARRLKLSERTVTRLRGRAREREEAAAAA